MMTGSLVFAFSTTHDALHAEEALMACGIEVEPVPTPKVTGTRCGIAMQVASSDLDAAVACMAGVGVTPVAKVVLDEA